MHSMFLNCTIIDEIFQFDCLFYRLFFIFIEISGFLCVKIVLFSRLKHEMKEIFLNSKKTIHYFNKYKSHAYFISQNSSYRN